MREHLKTNQNFKKNKGQPYELNRTVGPKTCYSVKIKKNK